MGYAVIIPNGIIHFNHVDAKCPFCQAVMDYKHFQKALAKNMYIHKKCKGCGKRFAIAVDMTGDTVSLIPNKPGRPSGTITKL